MQLPVGLYRDEDKWAVVRWGPYTSVLLKSDYEELGIKPAFYRLPTRSEYQPKQDADRKA